MSRKVQINPIHYHYYSPNTCFWHLSKDDSVLTCALPAAIVLLRGAHQFAVEVLLPVLSKPHVSPVVLQSPRCEVCVKTWKTSSCRLHTDVDAHLTACLSWRRHVCFYPSGSSLSSACHLQSDRALQEAAFSNKIKNRNKPVKGMIRLLQVD